MILECVKCQARYLVSGRAIGPEGRRVRCTACGKEWFQEPEEKPEPKKAPVKEVEVREEEPPQEIEAEPIPESVKPVPEGSALPIISLEDQEKAALNKARHAGYAAAACVFLATAAGFYFMHDTVVKLWPDTAALYERAGIKTGIEGEDLIFDGLKAVVDKSIDGAHVLTVDAKILNLGHTPSKVPPVQASLILENGEIVDTWLTELPVQTIEAEGEAVFKTVYPDVPENVSEVNVRFVAGPRAKGVAAKVEEPAHETLPEEHVEELPHEPLHEETPPAAAREEEPH